MARCWYHRSSTADTAGAYSAAGASTGAVEPVLPRLQGIILPQVPVPVQVLSKNLMLTLMVKENRI